MKQIGRTLLVSAAFLCLGTSHAAGDDAPGDEFLKRQFRIPYSLAKSIPQHDPFRSAGEREKERAVEKTLEHFGIVLGPDEKAHYDPFHEVLVVTASWETLRRIGGTINELIAQETALARVEISIYRLPVGEDEKKAAGGIAEVPDRLLEHAKARAAEGKGELVYAPFVVTRGKGEVGVNIGRKIRFVSDYELKGEFHRPVWEEVFEGLRLTVDGKIYGYRKRADLDIDLEFSLGSPVHKKWKVPVGPIEKEVESVTLQQFKLGAEVTLRDGETALLGRLPTESGESFLVFATAGVVVVGEELFWKEEGRGGD